MCVVAGSCEGDEPGILGMVAHSPPGSPHPFLQKRKGPLRCIRGPSVAWDFCCLAGAKGDGDARTRSFSIILGEMGMRVVWAGGRRVLIGNKRLISPSSSFSLSLSLCFARRTAKRGPERCGRSGMVFFFWRLRDACAVCVPGDPRPQDVSGWFSRLFARAVCVSDAACLLACERASRSGRVLLG